MDASEILLAEVFEDDLELAKEWFQGVPVGDNVDAMAEDGFTMLRFAVTTANLRAVVRLLDYGADPNLISRSNPYSLLYEAVSLNSLDITEALLKSGAEPDLCLPGLSSARHLAEDFRLKEFLRLFG